MKVNDVTKWIVINHRKSSLFNVIADGAFEHTLVGKNKWFSLMDGSLLQENCNKEEFNINTPGYRLSYQKVRIVANNKNHRFYIIFKFPYIIFFNEYKNFTSAL